MSNPFGKGGNPLYFCLFLFGEHLIVNPLDQKPKMSNALLGFDCDCSICYRIGIILIDCKPIVGTSSLTLRILSLYCSTLLLVSCCIYDIKCNNIRHSVVVCIDLSGKELHRLVGVW